MPLKIHPALAQVGLDALLDVVDVGAAPSTLVLYAGTVPTDMTSALITQTALATFTLADPAFGNSMEETSAARAILQEVADTTATASGKASFFRILDGDGRAVLQDTVSKAGDGGAMIINNDDVVTGGTVKVVSYHVDLPKG